MLSTWSRRVRRKGDPRPRWSQHGPSSGSENEALGEKYEVKIRNGKRTTPGRQFLKALSSVKLAVFLLITIAIVLILGTLLKNQSHARRYIYHSWWFLSLLSLFCLNLLLCTAGRWSLRLKKLGTTATHVGVLVMVVGVVIGAIWGERGYVQLAVGQAASVCYDDERRAIPLPFEIRLEDFKVERYSAAREALVVHVLKERVSQAFPIEVGKESQVKSTPYRVRILRYEPDFVILGQGKYGSRSQARNNPAVQVRVVNGSQEITQWVFLRFPGMHREENSNVRLDYRELSSAGRIKDFKSTLRLLDDGEVVASKTIEVNTPLKYGGYAVYQSSYDSLHEAWSGLEVARDPGVSLVYLGFGLISAGVLFTFYVRPLVKKRSGPEAESPEQS